MGRIRGFEECFFSPPQSLEGDCITITGPEAKHIAVVLRRRPGDSITVVNGCGSRFEIELTHCASDAIKGRVTKKDEFAPGKPELWLAVGIIKSARMDFLVEKCVELGVSAIVPVSTKRSLSWKGVSQAKLERWRRISIGAMTQSARVFLPKVLDPIPLEELFGTIGKDAGLFLAHRSGKSMQALRENELSKDRLVACVGPEGDFTPEEIELLAKNDAIAVALGRARLRVETAAMAVLDRLSFILERREAR